MLAKNSQLYRYADFCKKKVIEYRFLLLILFFYLLIHLIKLTYLPIFNDESIYLDWAWFNTHAPGRLYDSLLDAKQPLMIWIFGIFENFFADPLFAGRFASVLIGSTTLIGIYVVTKKLFNERTAFFAALMYSIIPIFVFYNRQALLEAGIMSMGIWAFYSLLNLLERPSTKNAAILGVILGLGFFIKSTSLIYILISALIISGYIIKQKKTDLLKPFLVVLCTIISVDVLILINPVFWQTLPTNSRYSFTLMEIFAFPISHWINNLFGFFEIGFVFMTPVVFITALAGIFLMIKNKTKNYKIFIFYFISALILEILLTKTQSQRYIVSFLPFLVIPASYVLNLLWSDMLFKKIIVIVFLFIPLATSLIFVFNPKYYILQLSKISKYSEMSYLLGQTSGYGINEAMQYIKEHSTSNMPSMVLFGLNIGNPESAIDVYTQKSPNMVGLHIDSTFFPDLGQYKCISSKYPVFLVTRDDQRMGMDQYFSLAQSFPNPRSNYSIKIYKIKENCEGKTLSISDMYQDSITKILQIRSGM